MNRHILTLFLIVFSLVSFAQSPQGFNYQAVARDAKGDLIVNKSIQVRTTIYSGTTGTNKEYQETHGVATNSRGHFSLIVGEGSPVSGQFDLVKWGNTDHHLQVEVDLGSGYVVMGKIKLQSVPYALFAASAPPTNDDDADSTNELQTLSIAGHKLSLTKGGSVDLPTELDGDPSNEIQTLTISNDTIFLSDGGSVILPATQTLAAGKGVKIDGGYIIARNDTAIWNADLIQGYKVKSGTPAVDDILQFDGSKWSLAQPSGGSGVSLWKKDGKNIYFDTHNVGINTKTPLFKLHIQDSIYGTGNGTIMTQNFLHGGTDGRYVNYAFRSVVQGHGGGDNTAGLFYSVGDVASNGLARGIYALADGDGQSNYTVHALTGEDASFQNYAVMGVSHGLGTLNIGCYGQAKRNANGTNYAIYGTADSASKRYAGYFAGNVAYTGTLSSASDMKFKHDVKDLSGAIDLVKALEPKTYYFNTEGDAQYMSLSSRKQFGFLAQDLEKTLPNLIHSHVQPKSLESKEIIEYKGVDYISLIPVLTQAIKEQQEMIELLQQQVETLQKQVDEK